MFQTLIITEEVYSRLLACTTTLYQRWYNSHPSTLKYDWNMVVFESCTDVVISTLRQRCGFKCGWNEDVVSTLNWPSSKTVTKKNNNKEHNFVWITFYSMYISSQ